MESHTMVATPDIKQAMTTAEFWDFCQLPENQQRFFELIEGEVMEAMPSNPRSSEVAGEILLYFKLYLRQNPIGRVTGEQGGYNLTPTTTVAPDVAFISKERQVQFPATGFNPIPPDLAVEVMSPSDAYPDVLHKVSLYLQHGTRLVWVVNEADMSVIVHTPLGFKVYSLEDTLDGGDVLPGFSLPVKAIFADVRGD
ncbi:MAG: Uma2 family endonuclease [Anaerolineae bacterium]|nr:MAG: Uma2 family endonuclease [Anaerolineae bacterium]